MFELMRDKEHPLFKPVSVTITPPWALGVHVFAYLLQLESVNSRNLDPIAVP